MTALFEADTTPARLDIHAQIGIVRQEISAREAMYTKQTIRGRMTQALASRKIGEMEAVLRTLEWIRDNEAAIREVVRKA